MYKILVADDDEGVRLLFEEELEDDGYEVVATIPRHGLFNAIDRSRPDLLLLDVTQSRIRCIETLERIRTKHPSLPVILCTADPYFNLDIGFATADGYVVKSSDLTKLKQKIRDVIGPKRPLRHDGELDAAILDSGPGSGMGRQQTLFGTDPHGYGQ